MKGFVKLAVLVCALSQSIAFSDTEMFEMPNPIRRLELSHVKPYIVPAHPNRTLTVRFPGQIERPAGNGFVLEQAVEGAAVDEDALRYVVSWDFGESAFDVAPMDNADMRNLNVHFEGRTYTFLFYLADSPMAAWTSLELVPAEEFRPPVVEEPAVSVERSTELPVPVYVKPTERSVVGFLDRLRILAASQPGFGMEDMASQMPGVSVKALEESSDHGLFRMVLTRVARDDHRNLIGFAVLIRNVSDEDLVFDPSGFGVRAGNTHYRQVYSDMHYEGEERLTPGEAVWAFFAIEASKPGKPQPLLIDNDWLPSARLRSPLINPGSFIGLSVGDKLSERRVK